MKGSKNREHSRIKVAKIYERIANCRNDHLHKLSRRLINENQVIGLEALIPSNMVKNKRLAKYVSDASWGQLKDLIIYKARESQHCSVVIMDTYYPSSHICSSCNQRLNVKLKLSDRSWSCPYCHAVHDRDINAAINIRNEAVKAYKEAKSPKGTLLLATH